MHGARPNIKVFKVRVDYSGLALHPLRELSPTVWAGSTGRKHFTGQQGLKHTSNKHM